MRKSCEKPVDQVMGIILNNALRARLPLLLCDRATHDQTPFQSKNTQRTRPLNCLPLVTNKLSTALGGSNVIPPPNTASHAMFITSSHPTCPGGPFSHSGAQTRSLLQKIQNADPLSGSGTKQIRRFVSRQDRVSTVMPLNTCGEA